MLLLIITILSSLLLIILLQNSIRARVEFVIYYLLDSNTTKTTGIKQHKQTNKQTPSKLITRSIIYFTRNSLKYHFLSFVTKIFFNEKND